MQPLRVQTGPLTLALTSGEDQEGEGESQPQHPQHGRKAAGSAGPQTAVCTGRVAVEQQHGPTAGPAAVSSSSASLVD